MDLRGHRRLPTRLELPVRACNSFLEARAGSPGRPHGRGRLGTLAVCTDRDAVCHDHRQPARRPRALSPRIGGTCD
eukprot:4428501-Pleurochrysis_carterae.AAC.1